MTAVDTDDADNAAEERVEAGRILFARHWHFVMGVADAGGLPPVTGIEIAFAGRSNVGKSSLINALVGQKGLARTSNTPGRTRELNLFASEPGLTIVDMPGYGYARASKSIAAAWHRLIRAYLRGRPNLRRVYLLVDSRRGLRPGDEGILEILDQAAVSYQIVLTKGDKPKSDEMDAVASSVAVAVAKRPAAHPALIVTSAETGHGIEDLRSEIAALKL